LIELLSGWKEEFSNLLSKLKSFDLADSTSIFVALFVHYYQLDSNELLIQYSSAVLNGNPSVKNRPTRSPTTLPDTALEFSSYCKRTFHKWK